MTTTGFHEKRYGQNRDELAVLLESFSQGAVGLHSYLAHPRGYLRWTLHTLSEGQTVVGELAWKQVRDQRCFVLSTYTVAYPIKDPYFNPEHSKILNVVPERSESYTQACNRLALRRWHRVFVKDPASYCLSWQEKLPDVFRAPLMLNQPPVSDYDVSRGGAILLTIDRAHLIATHLGPIVLNRYPLPARLTLRQVLEDWAQPSYSELLAIYQLHEL
jgi:hypothetical protein